MRVTLVALQVPVLIVCEEGWLFFLVTRVFIMAQPEAEDMDHQLNILDNDLFERAE